MTTRHTFGIFALLVSVIIAPHVQAFSSVWKISKGEDYFYLGGTIHVLSPADYPLPSEFDRAYEDAGTLIFETDMSELESPDFQAKFLEALQYNDGRTLNDELNPQTYRKLEAYLKSRGIPAAGLAKFQPWGLSLMIALIEYERLGMEPALGVDNHFHNRALADGKRTLGLETADDQLQAINSMENMDPNTVIEYTLRDLKQLPEFARFMKEAWRSGDVEAFSTDPMAVQMKDDFPLMYDALLVRRNNAWMKTLVTLTDNDQREFVLVGAMHLNDDDGLLSQLVDEGFLVEQL